MDGRDEKSDLEDLERLITENATLKIEIEELKTGNTLRMDYMERIILQKLISRIRKNLVYSPGFQEWEIIPDNFVFGVIPDEKADFDRLCAKIEALDSPD